MTSRGGAVWRNRVKKELEILKVKGIPFWGFEEEKESTETLGGHIRVSIEGPPQSCYSGGVFVLDIQAFERYPFEPPHVRFITEIYHPNVDESGRICLSVLKTGYWKPTYNFYTVLQSILQLMTEPNGEDALVAEIGEEFLKNKELFTAKAQKSTLEHARPKQTTLGPLKPPQQSISTTPITKATTKEAKKVVVVIDDDDDDEQPPQKKPKEN